MTGAAAGLTHVAPGDVQTVSRRRGQRAVLATIRAYQGLTSGRVGRVSPCRFYPSCSAYATEAVERHGALMGSVLALRRIARCRPGGGHGVDMVPDPRLPKTAAQ